MYADDTCLVYSGKDIKQIEYCIRDDLNRIIKWAHDNGIIINIVETKCMHIYSSYNMGITGLPKVIGHDYDC